MAKIVPQGYADIQQYDESDDYLQLMQYLDNIGQRYSEHKDKHISEATSSLTFLNTAIDSATNLEELERFSDLYDNTHGRLKGLTSSNLEILDSEFHDNYVTKKENFENFNSIASTWATNITGTNNILNTDMTNLTPDNIAEVWQLGERKDYKDRLILAHKDAGINFEDANNEYDVSYQDATTDIKEQMAAIYFEDVAIGTQSKFTEGFINRVQAERANMKLIDDSLIETFGVTENGQIKANPNYKIKYMTTDGSGNQIQQEMTLAEFRRNISAYDQRMEGLIMGALEDGFLSEEEATGLDQITGESGMDIAWYNDMIQKKRERGKALYDLGGKGRLNYLKTLQYQLSQENNLYSAFSAELNSGIPVSSESTELITDFINGITSLPQFNQVGMYDAETFRNKILNGEMKPSDLDFLVGELFKEAEQNKEDGYKMLLAYGGHDLVQFRGDPNDFLHTIEVEDVLYTPGPVTPGPVTPEPTTTTKPPTPTTLPTEEEVEGDFESPVNVATSKIAPIIKKYENVSDSLKNVNNLYAIKFGDRAQKYGATDSGIEAGDGGTFAAWPDAESGESNSLAVIEEMLLDDAGGDIKQYISNHIGQPIDSDEVASRYNEYTNTTEETSAPETTPPEEVITGPVADTGDYVGHTGHRLFSREGGQLASLTYEIVGSLGAGVQGIGYEPTNEDIQMLTRARQLISEDDSYASSAQYKIPIGSSNRTVTLDWLEDQLLPGMVYDEKLNTYVEQAEHEALNLNESDYEKILNAYNKIPNLTVNSLEGLDEGPPALEDKTIRHAARENTRRGKLSDLLGITTPIMFTGDKKTIGSQRGIATFDEQAPITVEQWYTYMMWKNPKELSKILKRNITKEEINNVLGKPTYHYNSNPLSTETRGARPKTSTFDSVGRNYVDWDNILFIDHYPFLAHNERERGKWNIPNTKEYKDLDNVARGGRIVSKKGTGRYFMWWDDNYGFTEIIPPKNLIGKINMDNNK